MCHIVNLLGVRSTRQKAFRTEHARGNLPMPGIGPVFGMPGGRQRVAANLAGVKARLREWLPES